MQYLPFCDWFISLGVIPSRFNVLNKSGKHGHSCLVPDLKGKTFSSALEYDSTCGLSYMAFYYVEVCFFYTHSVESFYHK